MSIGQGSKSKLISPFCIGCMCAQCSDHSNRISSQCILFPHSGLGGFGRNKGILGFLGGALFCVPFNYRILSCAKFASPPPAKATLALASLAFGLAGAFADLAVPTPALTLPKRILGRRVPPFHVDDNFVVPVFSGFACTQVFKALGWDLNLELAKCLLF